ncbi:hypothetical protein AcW2_007135 [Taiwanofungus camphoratus]|nr:hypothetical protein AcW2_007135 [Antrodia cinnamomea]
MRDLGLISDISFTSNPSSSLCSNQDLTRIVTIDYSVYVVIFWHKPLRQGRRRIAARSDPKILEEFGIQQMSAYCANVMQIDVSRQRALQDT